jgi:hypothetical protein
MVEIATSRRQQKVFIFCAPSSKGDKNASVCVDMMMAASIWWRKVANMQRAGTGKHYPFVR